MSWVTVRNIIVGWREILHFPTRISVHQVYRLALAFIFLFLVSVSGGQQQQTQQPPAQQQPPQQQQADTGQLPADQIIEILQANPELLSDAKAEIVRRLRDRGYAVTESDVTDERLFSQIQQDDRVREAVSDELKRRGFGAENTEQPETSTGTAQKPSPQPNAPRNQPSATGKEQGAPYGMTEKGVEKNDATGRRFYPYRNLPALQDLYTHSIADPTKLERFGAALFRNRTVSRKSSMDIPAGSDYVLGPGDELVIELSGTS